MSGLSGFQPVGTRLWRPRGESGDEYRRQYFLRSGSGRNRQDAFGTLRKGVAKTAVYLYQPAGRFHLHQHADGCTYPAEQDFRLTQGMFVGSVSDNFNERIEQKIFHCEIVVDAERVKREEKAYKPIPVITDFTDEDGKDCMKETVQANYRRIKEEVKQIVADELERIANDDNLKHLLQQK